MDPQGGAVAIAAVNDGGRSYDDGEWHHILALRTGNYGTITIDGQYMGGCLLLSLLCPWLGVSLNFVF